MDQGQQLFTLALGLVPPWAVDDVRFTVEKKRLDLHVNFPRGSHFPCPTCGQDCPVYDTLATQQLEPIANDLRGVAILAIFVRPL